MAEEYLEAKARVVRSKTQGILTYIEGFERPFPGWPDERVLKALDPLKPIIRKALSFIHGRVWKALPKREDLSQQVREIYDGFSKLINAEINEGGKQFWTQVRDVVCVILEYDTSYRWRLSWMAERMDLEKLKMTENDRYWVNLRKDMKW